MKITTEDLGDRQVMLRIEVDEKRVDNALRGVARRVARDYNIPGFRRGRAPYRVVLQRFGREALLQEALEDLVEEVYKESIESEELEPYDLGSVEDVQLDPLVIKLRVPLRPAVDLGDYRELLVEPPLVTVDDEDVSAELQRLRQANAILEPTDDRAAEMGDWVSLDVSAITDGETLVNKESYGMVLDAEEKEFEIGFSEMVVGMKVEEEKQFTLTLSDNWGEGKAGQEAAFTVTLREIRTRLVPDLDDDLARTVGDFDTLEELRQNIHDRFEEQARRKAEDEYADKVLKALVDQATIEYPPDVIEHQIDFMIDDLERRLESQSLSLDEYFKLTGQTEDAFRESVRPQAESIVERGLVLGELAHLEKLDVGGDELEERIALMSARWGERAGEVREALWEPKTMRSIASSLLTDKAVQRLVAIARGEAPLPEEPDQEVPEELQMAANTSTFDKAETLVEGTAEEVIENESLTAEASAPAVQEALVEDPVASEADEG